MSDVVTFHDMCPPLRGSASMSHTKSQRAVSSRPPERRFAPQKRREEEKSQKPPKPQSQEGIPEFSDTPKQGALPRQKAPVEPSPPVPVPFLRPDLPKTQGRETETGETQNGVWRARRQFLEEVVGISIRVRRGSKVRKSMGAAFNRILVGRHAVDRSRGKVHAEPLRGARGEPCLGSQSKSKSNASN